MAYSNRFVVNVLVDGQIQKELQSGQVGIPFGSEYSLRFRNKHNRRACVKFFIDNENVSGNGYIIPANDYVDIERHHDIDRAFKFVELDSLEAQDAGKNGPNLDGSKGLIEARFYLEKKQVFKPVEHHHWYGTQWHEKQWPTLNNPYTPPATPGYSTTPNWTYTSGNISNACNLDLGEIKTTSDAPNTCRTASTPEMQDGVTVEGNVTGQCFSSMYIDLEDAATTIKVILKGIAGEVAIQAPQSDVKYCTNCGAKKAKNAKFCGQCGTKL
jgi:hypothetical protein